jgi:hypothetical protein
MEDKFEGHEKGNKDCPMCCCGYPEKCECGGLRHVVELEEVWAEDDYWWDHTLKCDKCGK